MIICADDFGLSPGANQAIIELAGLGRVTAVSVMAALDGVDRATLAPLLELGDKIDVGLHLILAGEDAPSAIPPLPTFKGFMAKCWLGLYKEEEALRLIEAQYRRFVLKAGRTPDFIDGHLHVHQFPAVREALARFVAALPPPKPYVRNTYLPMGQISRQGVSPMKTWFISLPGAGMKRILERAGAPTNEGFTGIYDFADYRNYPDYLDRFTAAVASPSTIMMCHPGVEGTWRRAEYEAILRAERLNVIAHRFPRTQKESFA
jgi:hypothetical protein